MPAPFAAFPDTWPATRETLHAYAHAVGSVPRAHGLAHPKWWHLSLNVRPDGLSTDNVALPDGGAVAVRLDLRRHTVVVSASDGSATEFAMGAGTTGTAMGDQVIAAVSTLGLPADAHNRAKYENDDPREYDPAAAEVFFATVVNAATVLERHRSGLEGPVGPVQLWPHGFDLAFEWFGTRTEAHEDDGEITEYPSQINFGFYPGPEPYFYCNPWPFDEELLRTDLPHAARWVTESFQGSVYPYEALVGDPDAAAKLADYAGAVHAVAAPTLLS